MSKSINVKSKNVTTFHETNYGWNYGFEQRKNGDVRLFRYFTNGHQNENYQILGFKSQTKPNTWYDAEREFSQQC